MRVLILGGTTESRALADALADDRRFAPVYSLAGRTGAPLLPCVPARVGGFGGRDGLAAWLKLERIDAIVDATHPYAAQMSANAAHAAEACRVPLLRLQRPAWIAGPRDDWRHVASSDAAASALGTTPLNVFLAIGRSDIAAFRAAPQHGYVVRAVDAPDPLDLPPRATVILKRGPFALDDELAVLREHSIDVIVSKNSGGDAAYAKILAASQLGLPVVMIARPPLPVAAECAGVEAALDWLDTIVQRAHGANPSERGV